MKIEHLYVVNFTQDEVKSALADQIEFLANNEIAGSKENQRLLSIANKAREEYSYVELHGQDGVCLMVDGVAFVEDVEIC